MVSLALAYVAQTLPGTYDDAPNRRNEDDYFLEPIPPEGLLVAMLDGISSGGYGAVAARAARTAIQVCWNSHKDKNSDPIELVYQLMLAAQKSVLSSVQGHFGGTTCLCVFIKGGLLTFGHVGDCQLLYRRLAGKFTTITQDQTALVRTQYGRDINRLFKQSQQSNEVIDDQQLANYTQLENTLTRHLGRADLPPDPHQWVEVGQLLLKQGDCLLICTDGLIKACSLTELDAHLSSASPEQVTTLFTRIEQNYQHDRDDITLCLIEVCEPLTASEIHKPYKPTFLSVLGEEEDMSNIHREQHATITEDIQHQNEVWDSILKELLNSPSAQSNTQQSNTISDTLLESCTLANSKQMGRNFRFHFDWKIVVVTIILISILLIIVSQLFQR